MQNQLNKAINLAQKTGDRIIVVDRNDVDSVFVVMNLDEYEKLALNKKSQVRGVRGLTEGELIDKINRDIAVWKNEKENDDFDWRSDVRPFDSRLNSPEDNGYFDAKKIWNDDWDWDNDDDWDNPEDEDDHLYYYDDEDKLSDISDLDKNNFDFSENDFEVEADFKKDFSDRNEVKSFRDIMEERYMNDDDYHKRAEKSGKKSSWKIPSDVKKIAEEVIEN